MYGATISALIRSGAIALLHDYRAGHARDLVPGGTNHGTRSITGAFVGYVDGAAWGTGTDITTTISSYLTCDMDAGDKLALADVGGGHAVAKYLGVVIP